MKLSFLIAILLCSAQTTKKDDCLIAIKKFYKNAAGKMESGKDEILKMEFAVKTIMRDKKSYESSMTVIADEHSSVFLSKEMNVYQDEEAIVTIIPDRKLLYITEGNLSGTKQDRVRRMGLLQDSIFLACEVLSCNESVKNDTLYRSTILSVNGKSKEKYKIGRLEFLLKNDFMHHVKMSYVQPYPVSGMEITYRKVGFSSSRKDLHPRALSYAFTPENKLKPEFKNYQVMDSRIKK